MQCYLTVTDYAMHYAMHLSQNVNGSEDTGAVSTHSTHSPVIVPLCKLYLELYVFAECGLVIKRLAACHSRGERNE